MAEVKFLFDTQLIDALNNLIKEAKHELIIVSPFIDLDKRIQDSLNEKKSLHDFKLKILFGKNEGNLYKSIKKDSFEFLKGFPNVEIRYNEWLHAKFYQNDFDYLMTSLNLYDYSLANNIEVGIIGNYATKGLIGKVIDGTDNLIAQGVEKVRQDVFGMGKEIDPLQKFETIFSNSEIKYKTEPIIVDKSGLRGAFGGKELKGSNVVINNFDQPISQRSINEKEIVSNSVKTLSASQLSKVLNVTQADITDLMQRTGLVSNDKITEIGLQKGLLMKSYMGKSYISYPENLSEFEKLKK
ncbi:MAG: hypothetical protein IPJ32_04165 [Sphingobacteriaceae bacterium]|nr:hypothetical protein [Sphingobacteriaceae bacterium]